MCASALRDERSAPSSHRAAHMFHIFNHYFIETYYGIKMQFIFKNFLVLLAGGFLLCLSHLSFFE